ncbi:hypothetical protein TSUD_408120 [Trifolium subterraneum]|uniref:Phospho-2-dehydro-3-deoxyheptonate aldolase n=1 Tax=Trifolium subterraneum TaxID=3900 RepID=A0A2Z6P5G5_TRISU|nr:hypothetical protein TSUD_408120 [Trifolium subterraneum]
MKFLKLLHLFHLLFSPVRLEILRINSLKLQLVTLFYLWVMIVLRALRNLVLIILEILFVLFFKWVLFLCLVLKCLLSRWGEWRVSLQSRGQIRLRRKNGVKLPSYRGDNVNGDAFDAVSRTPDPQRMVGAYCQYVATLNLLRAFATGGYAAMQRINQWNLDFMEQSEQGDSGKQRVYKKNNYGILHNLRQLLPLWGSNLIHFFDERTSADHIHSNVPFLGWMEKTASDVISRMLVLLSSTCGLWFGSCNLPVPGHVVIYGPPVFNDPTSLTDDEMYDLRNRWATCFLELFNPKVNYDDADEEA